MHLRSEKVRNGTTSDRDKVMTQEFSPDTLRSMAACLEAASMSAASPTLSSSLSSVRYISDSSARTF